MGEGDDIDIEKAMKDSPGQGHSDSESSSEMDESSIPEVKDLRENKPKPEELIIEAKNFFDAHKKELGESLKKGNNVIYLDFMQYL